ncbi:MAG: hypoxanthine phosphoribosyltransferase [Bacteroidales bacterium]
MSQVKIQDKVFEKFIGNDQIDLAVEKIAREITRDFGDSTPLFLCVLKGSFMFAADLFKAYEGPCQISFIQLSSYKGTTSTQEVKTLIGLSEDIKDRDVIILEDIIDTGITIAHLLQDLKTYQPRNLKVASLLVKPAAAKTPVQADYVGMEIPNDFIVGYGLDYDGFGRNLKDIYKII